MTLSRLQDWIARVCVPKLPQAFQQGKMPYLFGFTSCVILALIGFSWVDPYPQTCVVAYVASALMVGQMVLIARGMPLHRAIHQACAIGAGCLMYAVWISGGVHSPRLSWLLVLPMIPFYIIGPRAGYGWLAAAFAMQLLMALLTDRGWLAPAQAADADTVSLYSFATVFIASLILLFVPLLYEREYQAALREGQARQKELEAKRAELEQALEMREHFIASVSHELRTPMNAILGFSSLLSQGVQHKPRAMEILNHTRQSADHLLTVINDVLDYSQFISGRLTAHAETFDLRETVRHAFDLFAPRVNSTHLSYRCEIADDVPPWVCTDRHRLMQILVNLLGNALKFTHQGEVVLHVQCDPRGVVFSVQDTGIGMALEDQPRIFSRFTQAQGDIQKRYGGNGLGLAITQGLVELLQGEISFDSTLGQGSRFWFVLPLQAQTPPASLKGPAARVLQTAQQAWQFLVVDDHSLNRLLVKQVLQSAWPHSTVVEADNGAKALELCRSQRFDLVFMDMLMPVMDGVQATQAIRQSISAHGLAPVIGLTANVNPLDLARFKDAGLSGLLLKPFDPARLCDEVEALLLRGVPRAAAQPPVGASD